MAQTLIRSAPGRRPRWGNLRRATPFSSAYGFDRGDPVDRFYIERFLAARSDAIRGDVLEVRDAEYTRRFGSAARSQVIDVDGSNPAATIVADLTTPGSVAAETFDCVILTQVLQYLTDPGAAVSTAWSALRPGGTLLITVPCLSRICPEVPDQDLWRWTPTGLRELLARRLPEVDLEVEAGGSMLTCVAFLYGIAIQELEEHELLRRDDAFPLVACAAARKPQG
jgi:SAM-dependent methyltransferase